MPRKRFSTQLDEDADIELTWLAQSSKLDRKFIASFGIMMVGKFKMLDPDFGARMKKLEAVRVTNKYEVLDDPCEALCWIDDHYECRWGRDTKTPDTKKIGKSLEAIKEGCAACRATLD